MNNRIEEKEEVITDVAPETATATIEDIDKSIIGLVNE